MLGAPPAAITDDTAQPPPEETGMKHYIGQLRAVAEQAQRQREAALAERGGNGRVQCEEPLEKQIEALMRSLPPAQRNRPWSMDELVARLHGRYHARPSAGSVGIALRQLGWTRIRDWSNNGGGRRIWDRLPP